MSIDIRQIAEQAGMRVNLLSMGAASMVYSDCCEGVTREHLERFAALVASAPAVPAGWALESGKGWISIRNLDSQLGQDFYPDRDPLIFAFLAALAAAPAVSAPAERTADDLREPKNGEAWRVHWWNESARLMLPADSKLDSFTSYKNGTLMFTIKRAG